MMQCCPMTWIMLRVIKIRCPTEFGTLGLDLTSHKPVLYNVCAWLPFKNSNSGNCDTRHCALADLKVLICVHEHWFIQIGAYEAMATQLPARLSF
jgi:hypothetical protein